MKRLKKLYLNMCKERILGLRDLEEPFTFDNTKKRFCVGICLVVVCQILNVIVIVRSFLPPFVCQSKNTWFFAHNTSTRTKFIVRNTGRTNCSSCIAETTVLNHFKWLCALISAVTAVQAQSMHDLIEKYYIDGLIGQHWLNLIS